MAKGSSQEANDLRKANNKRRKLGILERMNIEDWMSKIMLFKAKVYRKMFIAKSKTLKTRSLIKSINIQLGKTKKYNNEMQRDN